MDCSLPGSSDYGILQARILQWVKLVISSVQSLSCVQLFAIPQYKIKSLKLKKNKIVNNNKISELEGFTTNGASKFI